jgi:predicted transcriptional regulator
MLDTVMWSPYVGVMLTRQIAVRLDQDTIATIERVAARNRRNLSWVMREALQLYLPEAENAEPAFEPKAGADRQPG